jgi:hypothetical protein
VLPVFLIKVISLGILIFYKQHHVINCDKLINVITTSKVYDIPLKLPSILTYFTLYNDKVSGQDLIIHQVRTFF